MAYVADRGRRVKCEGVERVAGGDGGGGVFDECGIYTEFTYVCAVCIGYVSRGLGGLVGLVGGL